MKIALITNTHKQTTNTQTNKQSSAMLFIVEKHLYLFLFSIFCEQNTFAQIHMHACTGNSLYVYIHTIKSLRTYILKDDRRKMLKYIYIVLLIVIVLLIDNIRTNIHIYTFI